MSAGEKRVPENSEVSGPEAVKTRKEEPAEEIPVKVYAGELDSKYMDHVMLLVRRYSEFLCSESDGETLRAVREIHAHLAIGSDCHWIVMVEKISWITNAGLAKFCRYDNFAYDDKSLRSARIRVGDDVYLNILHYECKDATPHP